MASITNPVCLVMPDDYEMARILEDSIIGGGAAVRASDAAVRLTIQSLPPFSSDEY